MARIIVIFLLVLYSSISQAQSGILSKEIAATQLPKGIKFNGKLLELWTWRDNSGENFLLLTKIPDYPVKSAEYNEDARSSDIYAYQYVRNDTGYRMVWKLMDYIKECPFDITLGFFKGSVSITDLDADGIAEATIIYKLSCRSDVSPDYMKLIIREGTAKYSLRGWMCDPGNDEQKQACVEEDSINLEKLPKPTDEWEQILLSLGRYETEKEFSNAPVSFLSFVRREWLKYVKKSFD
jgi:hypothetical protein